MRLNRTILLAGTVALGVTAGIARAASPDTHMMSVRLPDGSVAQIEYAGDVPPRVMVPVMPAAAAFAPADPFALMARMSAAMDRQMAAMMQATRAMMAQPLPVPDGVTEAGFGAPAAGGAFCAQSVQITWLGNGQPQVVRHSAGNCGASDSAAPAALPAAPPTRPAVKTIEVRNQTAPAVMTPGHDQTTQVAWRG